MPSRAQQAPSPETTEIAPLVVADIQRRVAAGVASHGTPLQANNGRDPLVDLYEELLDGAMYLRQHMVERAAWRPDPLVVRMAEAAEKLCDVVAQECVTQRMWDAAGTLRNAINAYEQAMWEVAARRPGGEGGDES